MSALNVWMRLEIVQDVLMDIITFLLSKNAIVLNFNNYLFLKLL